MNTAGIARPALLLMRWCSQVASEAKACSGEIPMTAMAMAVALVQIQHAPTPNRPPGKRGRTREAAGVNTSVPDGRDRLIAGWLDGASKGQQPPPVLVNAQADARNKAVRVLTDTGKPIDAKSDVAEFILQAGDQHRPPTTPATSRGFSLQEGNPTGGTNAASGPQCEKFTQDRFL